MFDHLVLWGIAVGGVGAAVALSIGFVTSDLRAKRSLRKLACTRIADAHEGQRVKLVGTIAEGESLVSPNRNASCVYYHAWHEELKPGVKGGVGWVSVGDEQDGCSFTIADDSGVARVDAEGIVGVLADGSYVTITGASPNTRGREAIVSPGQRVAVIGMVTLEQTPGSDSSLYRDGAARVVLRSSGRTPVIVSDDSAIVGASS